MNKKKIIFFLLTLHSFMGWGQKVLQLQSPDKKTTLQISIDKDLSIGISQNGTVVLEPSVIGMDIREAGMLGEAPKLKKVERRSVSGQKIVSPVYKKSTVDETYNELTANFKGNYSVVFRCYNQGVAYRFVTELTSGQVTVNDEKAIYKFPEQAKGYAAYSNRGKDGNIESQFLNSFENTYDCQPLSSLNSQRLIILPFLAEIPGSNTKVCITESDLYDYPGMFLRSNTNDSSMQGVYATVPKTTEQGGHNMLQKMVKERHDYIAKTNGKRSFPWRIFAISENDKELLDNDLVFLLGKPSPLTDLSWIKPGKVAWDWWNDWNLKGVDFKAGINFDTYKYYIDFAHNHGLEYIILDEGWYNSKEGSILKPIDDIQLPKLIEYGKSKGVDIVLWAVFNVMDENLETICKTYADMGIKGFKVDFMDRDDQTAIEMVERLAACTAKHHLILDLHGIYKPHGLNRTYPNILNYESVFGMEECRWTEAKNDMPLYDVTFPYIRMMAGQVDFTPGAMRNGTRDNWKAIYTKPISMGTRCHQAACYIVQDSPFTMLADTPTNYEADEPYTRYIASLPVVFDKTIVPQGEIGKYIVTARKKGNDWYVGGQSNWDERTLTLKFDFLADGDYEAIVLKDGINANHDAEDYKIEKSVINQKSEMKIHLASGGGFVIKVIKK